MALTVWATARIATTTPLEGKGQLLGFKGASGPVQFDSECYTAALNTTYVNWVINGGRIYNQTYYSAKGNAQSGKMLASWNYLVEHAEDRFRSQYSEKINTIIYPALSDQYAVLVQGSNGWLNYRHEADVLSIYQMLKANGYNDDHIILITADDCANAPENTDVGAVRTDPGGQNLRQGAVIDYRNADLTPQDICNILKGVKTDRTPIVLPTSPQDGSAGGSNILFFWSGHGRSKAVNGVNEMAWRDHPAGQGMTAELLAQTLREMADGTYRDFYLYCALHTLGSHVGIYNYTNFGNLYTNGPKEFFVKSH